MAGVAADMGKIGGAASAKAPNLDKDIAQLRRQAELIAA